LLSDETPHWQRKIDHRLRALWARVPELDRAHHSILVLLRFTRSDDSLKELGVQVHSIAGDIASGAIMLADLPRIANAAEILFMELAQPLKHD
jgi:hypothetical protein